MVAIQITLRFDVVVASAEDFVDDPRLPGEVVALVAFRVDPVTYIELALGGSKYWPRFVDGRLDVGQSGLEQSAQKQSGRGGTCLRMRSIIILLKEIINDLLQCRRGGSGGF